MQNPALTEHLRYIEQEKTRAYIAATMRWSCLRPSERDACRGMKAFRPDQAPEVSVA